MHMKKYYSTLKSFNWNLFIALCLLPLVPALWQTVRTYLVTTTVSTAALDVIGQMEWFDLIDETIKAFLIVPLYAVLSTFLTDKEAFGKNVFKTALITFALYGLFSIGVFVYALHLVSFMNPSEVDVAVASYLRLETIAFIIGILPSFFNVVFVVLGKSRNVYAFLVIGAVVSILSDLVMVPAYGALGVAYTNILTNSLLAVAGFVLLLLEHSIHPSGFHKADLPMIGKWAKIGAFSGSQQFVDNIIYALMICKMVNAVAEQGNYWVANNFIWGWLLIPISALAEIIRRDSKDGYLNVKERNYYFIIALIVLIWAVTLPSWPWFFSMVEQLENAQEIYLICLRLIPFYVAYALCTVPDNLFIGLGKTKYSLINSLIVNIVYYGIFYLCYHNGLITMTMTMIILMFGFGMVVHLAISWIEEWVFLKRENLKISTQSKKGE
jgi:O-antigen/teichoic acid export membrane protein